MLTYLRIGDLRTALLLVEIPKQGALNDVLMAETPLKCEQPKALILRLGEAEYASALEEWAGRLGMDPLQLNRLVPTGGFAPEHGPR